MPADVTGVALTTQLVCWRPKGRRHRAGQRCFARGNLVRIRDCPAAVCRNDRRLGSRQALVSTTGKRRPVGAPTGCEPASPKTCQPCRTRRARRLIASWNGRLAVPVAGCIGVHLNRIGCASAGGEPPVDRRTARDPVCTSSTLYRNHHRLPAHRPAPRTQARHRRLLGRTYQPIRAGGRRRHVTPRHLVGPGRGRSGLGAGEHLLLLRPNARYRGAARRAAAPSEPGFRRAGPLFRRGAGHRPDRAAGDDEVVRHQLPLPGTRDRAVDHVHAAPRQGARRTQRGVRARHSRTSGDHRADHLPAAEQGRRRRGGADRTPRRVGSGLFGAAVAACRRRRPVGAVRRAGAGDRPLPRRARPG